MLRAVVPNPWAIVFRLSPLFTTYTTNVGSGVGVGGRNDGYGVGPLGAGIGMTAGDPGAPGLDELGPPPRVPLGRQPATDSAARMVEAATRRLRANRPIPKAGRSRRAGSSGFVIGRGTDHRPPPLRNGRGVDGRMTLLATWRRCFGREPALGRGNGRLRSCAGIDPGTADLDGVDGGRCLEREVAGDREAFIGRGHEPVPGPFGNEARSVGGKKDLLGRDAVVREGRHPDRDTDQHACIGPACARRTERVNRRPNPLGDGERRGSASLVRAEIDWIWPDEDRELIAAVAE